MPCHQNPTTETQAHALNEYRSNHNARDNDLTWKTPQMRRVKTMTPTSKSSLYAGVSTQHRDFTDATHPVQRLTRGIYSGGNLG
jgi:hypothetical protein